MKEKYWYALWRRKDQGSGNETMSVMTKHPFEWRDDDIVLLDWKEITKWEYDLWQEMF